MRRLAFTTYHPAVNFAFFAGAIACSMCFRSPAFLAVSLVFSLLMYVTVRGWKAFFTIAGLVLVFVAVSVVNPLINTLGDTVLFTWLGGRPYTLEALFFGMALAGMFAAMLMWFGSYNRTMSSDKFTYLFGSIAPAVSLVLCMVLRFVPNYQRKAAELGGARSCVGKAGSGTLGQRLDYAFTLTSALASWGLEHGVVTADSMNSRGYGSGARSSYVSYRIETRDVLALVAMSVLLVLTVASALNGAADVQFVPSFAVARPSLAMCVGLVSYAAFLALPSIINIRELVQWRISISRI